MPFFIMIVVFAFLNSCSDSKAFTIEPGHIPIAKERIEFDAPDWKSEAKKWIRNQLNIPSSLQIGEFKFSGSRITAINGGLKLDF